MKRSLVLSICAAALVACFSHSAQATVDVQLNLQYTNPGNEALGGTWELLAQSDTGTANGLAGLKVTFSGIDGTVVPNTGTGTPTSVFDNVTSVFRFNTLTGGNVEIVAGDDLAGALITGVGTGGASPGNVPQDDLFTNVTSDPWDDSALLATGTFGAVRPAFVETLANEFGAGGSVVAASIGDTSVRGDGVASGELISGDLDRSGDVDLFGDVLGALANVSTGITWGEGDFNASGDVDLFGDVLGALANVGLSVSAPPVSGVNAVPEPSSIGLLTLAIAALAGVRRKS